MATSVRWNGKEYQKRLEKHVSDNLDAAAIWLEGKVKVKVNKAYPLLKRRKKRKRGKKKG